MNIDGISEYNKVSVEILDERFEAVPGYSRDTCVGPEESGLCRVIKWQNRKVLEGLEGQVRIRVSFEGIRPEDLRLYAVYIEHTG